MKLKNTLILLLVAGVIFAFIALYEKNRPGTREARDQAGRVVQLDRDEINAVTIRNAGTVIELRKHDNHVWTIEEPVKDRADPMAVAQLFTSAESLRHDAVIGEEDKGGGKEQVKDFGLSNPDVRVTFSGGKRPVEILFGKDAAVEGKVYVRLADSNTVYVIPDELKNLISRKPDEFRDPKLTNLATTQIQRVEIQSKAGEIEMARKEDQWMLVKPLQARGDDSKINDLIAQATNVRVDEFVADASNLGAYGLQEPRGAITLQAEGAEKPEVLTIGGQPQDEDQKDKTYARLSTRDAVVLLPKNIEQLLDTKPNELRDRRLVRIDADIIDRITIGSMHGKLTIARSGEAWVRKGEKDEPVNSALALRLISDLQAQEAVDFVADAPADLARFGLDQPRASVTLSSFASENTAETQAGEKPIVSVLFGNTDGEYVYAKLDTEPFVVTVPRRIFETLPSDPLQWQALAIYRMKPEEIVAFELTLRDQPPLALERENDRWKLAKGDGTVDQTNVQSLVNTVAQLRAVRWVGATIPPHGMDEPTTVLTFRTSNNETGRLTIGNPTPDDLWHAIAEGLTGTFLINRPDHGVFHLPLLEKPAPAPATEDVQTPPPVTPPAPPPFVPEPPGAPPGPEVQVETAPAPAPPEPSQPPSSAAPAVEAPAEPVPADP